MSDTAAVDLVESLFAPESVVPEGLRESPASGERRLMLAILENAIRAALDPTRTASAIKDRLRARAWILAQGSPVGYGGISFDLCCTVNGVDPDWLRGGIVCNRLWRTSERASLERVFLSRQHGLTKRANLRHNRRARSAEP